MSDLNYIECSGVRVPSDWNIKTLEMALMKRKIRFQNEKEIMAVFGEAVNLKSNLEEAIRALRKELVGLQDAVKIQIINKAKENEKVKTLR